PKPRPTAIAKMLTCLANGKEYNNPLFNLPGWWNRPNRFFYPLTNESEDFGVIIQKEANWLGRGSKAIWWSNWDPIYETETIPEHIGVTEKEVHQLENITRPVLIIGASGLLGSAFARICGDRHIPYRLIGRRQMNITDPFSIERALNYYEPWAVINAAGYVNVDQAEQDAETCQLINTHGAMLVAATCHKRNIQYLTFSSDLVFDGRQQRPYTETDLVNPLSVYGKSKVLSEKYVLDMNPQALIVRTSSLFGPWDNLNFLTSMVNTLTEGGTFRAAEDITVSPTYVPDLVHACLDLLMDEETGIWHLTNDGEVSWADLARKGAEIVGLESNLIQGAFAREIPGFIARRPKYSVLSSQYGRLLPSLDDALLRYTNRLKQYAQV
ncbi:MAG: SDR family oxidoreductase, partial [Bacteroidota bacterium]|nr:SDR family oxidoreductase [Bacteroidota bacterium]